MKALFALEGLNELYSLETVGETLKSTWGLKWEVRMDAWEFRQVDSGQGRMF